MSKADKLNDLGRLEEIGRLKLNEEQVDDILNEYVTKASEEFDLPIGLVSIVLDGAQVFAASHGLKGWLEETQATPVEWSFCANSVESEGPFIVEDATAHDLVKDNPLVTIDNVKCYAGVPLITKNGYVIGNFCVIGDKSRSFTENEIDKLRQYAHATMERLEERIK